MDSKELRGLVEAYSEVYAPEQLDEGYQEPRLDRKAFVKHANKRGGFSLGTREDPHGWREPEMEKVANEYAKRTSSARIAKRTGNPDTYRAEKESQSKLRKEELDIFDVVLEFLQVNGYAETLEEAEWMMANLIDEEAVAIILGEAEVEKSPYHNPQTGKMMSYAERQKQLKDKAEKIRASRTEEYVDEGLSGKRYKKVMNKPGGTAYSRKVSEDPSKRSSTLGGRGGESDFGAGDRGSGNKAARRAGTYQ